MIKIYKVFKEITAWYFPKKEDKVFCIGMHKTGTTSLAKALTILGYRVRDYPSVRLLGDRFLWLRGTQINDFNCFTDATIIPLYKRLDKKFPNSKFIITIRPINSWLESCSKWPNFIRPNVTGKRKIYRERVLGAKNYDEVIFKEKYQEHFNDVTSYFKNRQKDLLLLDLYQDNKWEAICEFLKKPKPQEDYPHSNAGTNKRLINKIVTELGLDDKTKDLAHNKFLNDKKLNEDKIKKFLKDLS